MKKIVACISAFVMILGFSLQVQAELISRGTDNLGNRLIYDSSLDLTWYDYTHGDGNWQYQTDWAQNLTVNWNGKTFDDWRLPITFDQNQRGYECTNSELGYLHYTELGNRGWFDADGNWQSWGDMLKNKGLFINLQSDFYWSATEYINTGSAWGFNIYNGEQDISYKGNDSYRYGIAVREGDVASVPLPAALLLFGSGLTCLLGIRRRFER